MIKRLLWFFVGFLGSSIIYFSLVYIFGLALSNFEINLYNSESDQQRNFNIVMGTWLLFGIVGGWFLSKKC